jgi:hypothetical protein
MGLTLRDVRDEDLPLLFEQWADPVAAHMAAFRRRFVPAQETRAVCVQGLELAGPFGLVIVRSA